MSEKPKQGLVIVRKVGEKILVEHGILEIEIVSVDQNKVRLKFIGNVKVDRAEWADLNLDDE